MPFSLDKPTVILVAGTAGVGKTTLARVLVSELTDSLLIDKDTVNEAFLRRHSTGVPGSGLQGAGSYSLGGGSWDRDSDRYHRGVRFQSYLCLLRLAEDNVRLGKSPVLDGNYHKEISNGYLREILLPHFSQIAVPVKIVFCHASADIIAKRLVERNHPRDRDKIGSSKAWSRFLGENPVIPPELEGYAHVKADMEKPLSEILPGIIRFLVSS